MIFEKKRKFGTQQSEGFVLAESGMKTLLGALVVFGEIYFRLLSPSTEVSSRMYLREILFSLEIFSGIKRTKNMMTHFRT